MGQYCDICQKYIDFQSDYAECPQCHAYYCILEIGKTCPYCGKEIVKGT
jgi:hypothetical protein